MKTRRRKKPTPIMLLWSRRDQARFSESVETLAALIKDAQAIIEPAKRKRAARAPATALLALFPEIKEIAERLGAQLSTDMVERPLRSERIEIAYAMLQELLRTMGGD